MPLQHDTVDHAHRVLDHAASMLAYWGADLRCRYANEAYRRWFGIAPEGVLGMHIAELLGADIYALNSPHIAEALDGKPQVFERAIPGGDGVCRHSLARYHPDVVNGVVVGFIAEVADVTPVKVLELALMEGLAAKEYALAARARKDRALEAAQRLGQIGSWEWEPAADITTWSPELYRLFGRDPGRLSPGFVEHAALYAPASWECLRDAVSEALACGRPYQLALEFVRQDGSHGWMDARGEVERDGDGVIVALRGTAQDVTQAYAMADTLRRQAQRLKLALASAQLGLLRADMATGAVTCENDRARDLFDTFAGAQPVDAAGFVARCLHPGDAAAFRAALAACARGGGRFHFKGRCAPRAGGETCWIECFGQMETGAATATMIWTVADITATMAAGEALQQVVATLTASAARRGRSLSILGHELRNSLAPLAAGVYLLGREPNSGAARSVHAAMLRQLRHVERLVEDLDGMAEPQPAEPAVRRTAIALEVIVEDASAMVRAAMDKAGHSFTIHLPAGTVPVQGDPVRLTQVLVNLLCNAAKFTPAHGVISITLQADTPGMAAIIVRDNGVGIPADKLEDIFGMYVQLHAPASHSDDGLGIGLYLARQLVALHGGTLHAYSAGAGQGCTMTVRLPADGGVQVPAL